MLGYTEPESDSRPHITATADSKPEKQPSDVQTEAEQSQTTQNTGIFQELWDTVERNEAKLSLAATLLFLGNTALTGYNTIMR